MEIENRTVALAQCRPHPRNYNRHDDAQIADLRLSLQLFGQVRSIVVQEAESGFLIVAGHGVAQAAQGLELETLRADVIPGDWDEARVLAYLAADNELARRATADDAQLAALVADVRAQADEELAKLAAGSAERLKELLAALEPPAQDPGAQMDKAEELLEKWGVKTGDVWQCGEHFVICGDCRESETWKRLLEVAGVDKVNGVFTSPPYAAQRKKQYGAILSDQYIAWWEAVQMNVKQFIGSSSPFFVNIKSHVEDMQRSLYVMDLVIAMVRRWGWKFVDELIWVHQGYPGAYKYRFKNQFEPVYRFGTEEEVFEPVPEEDMADALEQWKSVFQFNNGKVLVRPANVGKKPSQSHYDKIQAKTDETAHAYAIQKGAAAHSGMGNFFYYKKLRYARPGNVVKVNIGDISGGSHAASFPVKLPAFFIRAYSDDGDVWCDPFLGGGTMVVAALQSNRRGLGIEKLEKYVAVALERLEGMGLTPRLVAVP